MWSCWRYNQPMTLVYLALAWLGGILLSHLLWTWGMAGCATPQWPFGALAAGTVAGVILLRRRPGARLAALLLAAAILGGWRYQAHPLAACLTPNTLAYYATDSTSAPTVTIEGIVADYPDVRDTQTQYRLRAATLLPLQGNTQDGTGSDPQPAIAAPLPVTGDVLIQAAPYPAYHYGDRLRITGRLELPPVFDDFDYRGYLARQGIHVLMRRPNIEGTGAGGGNWLLAQLYALRERGASFLNAALPEPAAGLANGMLLGLESGIPAAVNDAFKATGTSHVIVISGANITLLSGALMAALQRLLGRRRAALPAAVGIGLYVLLVGAGPASARAGLMGILYVIDIAAGRESAALVSLFFSGVILTLINPLMLFDAGCQLSFLATLGLIGFAAPLKTRVWAVLARLHPHAGTATPPEPSPLVAALIEGLTVTIAAQITALPLIVFDFGRLSLVSLLANGLILPAQPPIMLSGVLALAGGLISPALGRVIAAMPWLFLTYTTWVVGWCAKIPLASVDAGAWGRTLVVTYYVLLGGALVIRRLTAIRWLKLPSRPVMGMAAAAVVPLWLLGVTIAAHPDGRLHVIYVPAPAISSVKPAGGQTSAHGEAVLIISPAGRTAWMWDGHGDGAALAAATRALLPGPTFRVDLAVSPPANGQQATALWPGSSTVDPAQLPPGTAIRLDDGVTLTRLDAGAGWAFSVSYGDFRTVLPATLSSVTQAVLVNGPVGTARSTVLKTAGPSTGAWPTRPYLAAATAQLLLWPDETTYPPDVAGWLAAHNAIRVPDSAGVDVSTDGQRLWLHRRATERWP
jgi:competence protein ComEC